MERTTITASQKRAAEQGPSALERALQEGEMLYGPKPEGRILNPHTIREEKAEKIAYRFSIS